MQNKERRCLKATIYLYVPDAEEINDEKIMKYYVGKQPGRIQLYDEQGNKIGDRMEAFNNLGQMLEIVTDRWLEMWKSRFKKRDK